MNKSLTFFLFCCMFNVCQAQDSKLILQPNTRLPLVVVVSAEIQPNQMLQSVEQLPEPWRSQHHFLLLFGENLDSNFIALVLNTLLNRDEGHNFDKQRIYLLAQNIDAKLEAYLQSRSLFADAHFQRKESVSGQPFLETLLTKWSKSRLWEIDVTNIEQNHIKYTVKYRKLGLGFLLGHKTQKVLEQDTAYLPNRINTLGILLNYRLSRHLQLMTRISGSFKVPNQKKLQSSIFDQIDPNEGGEQTISAELKLHVFVQNSFQLNYLFHTSGKLQAYTGAGLSAIFFAAAKTKIEETIDFSNFSGGIDGLGFDSANDLPLLSRFFFDPYFSAGARFEMSKHSALLFQMDYHFANQKGKVNETFIDQHSFKLYPNLGVQWTFSKTSSQYQYLNASKRKKPVP